MDHRISKLGFAFGNYSDDTYKYEYICINKKRTYVWGIGTNDNSVETLKSILVLSKETNYEIPCPEQSAINIHSLRINEFYSVDDIEIICIKGEK